MNRRHFLLSIATLLATQNAVGDEILKGNSAKSGERDRAVWLTANKLKGLRLAKQAEQIQIIFFVDPNCPACAALWQWFDTQPPRNIASLWVPVSYMSKSSATRSVALLREENAYAALVKNYANFDRANRLGGIAPAEEVALQEQSNIRRNTYYWAQQLFGATPLMLYRTNGGKYMQVIGLLPETERNNMLQELAPMALDDYVQS